MHSRLCGGQLGPAQGMCTGRAATVAFAIARPGRLRTASPAAMLDFATLAQPARARE